MNLMYKVSICMDETSVDKYEWPDGDDIETLVGQYKIVRNKCNCPQAIFRKRDCFHKKLMRFLKKYGYSERSFVVDKNRNILKMF